MKEDAKEYEEGSFRVLRGGSWNSFAEFCRSGFRYRVEPSESCDDVGFRLLRTATPCPSYTFTFDDCERAIAASKEFIPIPGKNYEVGKTLVTQEEWEHIMGSNPSNNKQGGKYPIESVSFYDIQKFIKTVNDSQSLHMYRLPTEEEWEHFARAGTTTDYSFGDDPKDLDQYAWFWENSRGKTQPVAQKKPNPWGLYDIHGNVWEMTSSVWE